MDELGLKLADDAADFEPDEGVGYRLLERTMNLGNAVAKDASLPLLFDPAEFVVVVELQNIVLVERLESIIGGIESFLRRRVRPRNRRHSATSFTSCRG